MPSNLRPLSQIHIPAVAQLHCQALAGDFLPSLGEHFLEVFYQTVLSKGLCFGFVAHEEMLEEEKDYSAAGVSGFILGSFDTSSLFRKVLIGSAFQLGFAALPAILRQPTLILKALETLLYPNRESVVSEKAELLVIAIDKNRRGEGLGKGLVQALNLVFNTGRWNENNHEVVFHGVATIPSYKVTVLGDNQSANAFYLALGFELAGQFRLYKRDWNIYTCTL